MQVWSLGGENTLEQEMTTHSSVLTWRIPWMEKPGGLQSMGLQRVGHNWASNTRTQTLIIFCVYSKHSSKGKLLGHLIISSARVLCQPLCCISFILYLPSTWLCMKLLQVCLTFCDLVGRSPLGSSVHGIPSFKIGVIIIYNVPTGSKWWISLEKSNGHGVLLTGFTTLKTLSQCSQICGQMSNWMLIFS